MNRRVEDVAVKPPLEETHEEVDAEKHDDDRADAAGDLMSPKIWPSIAHQQKKSDELDGDLEEKSPDRERRTVRGHGVPPFRSVFERTETTG